jgi:hypothetical protein
VNRRHSPRVGIWRGAPQSLPSTRMLVMERNSFAGALVGSHEIAKRLGLAQAESVHTWRRRYADFPAPVASLSIGYVWSWPDVEKWAHRTGRGSWKAGASK